MRIAINGMGRIGRLLFRRLLDHPTLQVVAVNDVMDPENLSYLVKYDSVYGHADFEIQYSNQKMIAKGQSLAVLQQPDPLQLPWKDLGIDMVLECTGRFTTKALASQHVQAGADKVLLSTTGADDIPLMIFGFNHVDLDLTGTIYSPGGCMTNCSVPLIDTLGELEPESVQIHVIHSYTSRQELVDAPHKDFRRGRAAAESIIPVPVDLAHSLQRMFPALDQKIAALTTRVPVANGAFADFSFQIRTEASAREVNDIVQKAAKEKYHKIIEYTEEPLVSLDIKANPHSAVIDGSLTSVVGRQVKLFAFFDNEYGYTSRMIDWLMKMDS